MRLPQRVPYLQTITILWGLYALVWIPFEGHLVFVVSMAVSSTAVLCLHLLQRPSNLVFHKLWQWLTFATMAGIVVGLTAVGLTLMFMALKTGLHNHGPEFTLEEIQWVIQQLPNWSIIGAFMGAGLGLISAGMRSSS